MLTVLVRGCMFPLSRKQALSAQKMQELQPEMKKHQREIQERRREERRKAQQELFRKHNYNPLGGCLLVFIQLPIFIGLVPLADGRRRAAAGAAVQREHPLVLEPGRARHALELDATSCPSSSRSGTGFFGLGPYFNMLPLLTIGLFIWQQKMFMPPPADEQAAMQQKMMQYMMIFMGVMFFKVASGLCVYFIASSLWGIAERKLLPKTKPPSRRGCRRHDARPSRGHVGQRRRPRKKRQRGRK